MGIIEARLTMLAFRLVFWDGSGDPGLSVYIRKLYIEMNILSTSLGPYQLTLHLVKNESILTMEKVSNSYF